MKTIILYDSNYGNTQCIAKSIASELGAEAIKISDFKAGQLSGLDLLIVGSPINGWMPTKGISNFLSKLTKDELKNTKAASFDTRVKLFIHGDAAGKISRALEKAGAKIISRPQGFFVKGTEGPLLEGEIERALAWAKSFAA